VTMWNNPQTNSVQLRLFYQPSHSLCRVQDFLQVQYPAAAPSTTTHGAASHTGPAAATCPPPPGLAQDATAITTKSEAEADNQQAELVDEGVVNHADTEVHTSSLLTARQLLGPYHETALQESQMPVPEHSFADHDTAVMLAAPQPRQVHNRGKAEQHYHLPNRMPVHDGPTDVTAQQHNGDVQLTKDHMGYDVELQAAEVHVCSLLHSV
jgi:hypothetical protein